MIDYKDISKKQGTSKKPGKVMPDKTVKVKNQTSTIMKKGKGEPAKESGRTKQKREQQAPTTTSGFQARNPMTSRKLKQSSDKPKKIRRVADEFVRGNRKSSLNRPPVKGNVGEFKTSGETKVEKERKRKVSFPIKNKSLNTRGNRTNKIEQARKAKISLQRAGGGKVGSKFFTGGMVNPSYGTEFDDR